MMFLSPWLLLALTGLPLLWWLLRATPPAPQRERFPSLRLLRGLAVREETPARTPWWLLLLRMAAAALLIIGLAGPVTAPRQGLPGQGPLLLVLDDGWASAPRWAPMLRAAGQILDRAALEGRDAALLTTAPAGDGTQPRPTPPMPVPLLRARIAALRPYPWAPDHRAAAEALAVWRQAGTAAFIGDSLAWPGDDALASRLRAIGPVITVEAVSTQTGGPEGQPGEQQPGGQTGGQSGGQEEGVSPRLLLPPRAEADRLILRVAHAGDTDAALNLRLDAPRADASSPDSPRRSAAVLAQTADRRTLARGVVPLPAGPGIGEAPLILPPEIRNQLARLVLEGPPGAGSTVLLDERSRKRPVGLVTGDQAGADTPLLGTLYYLRRALEPYAEVREGDLNTLLARALSVLILADRPVENAEEHAAIQSFVEKGGLLIRFAGPRLAANPDDLLPVRLLSGDRQLGGAMSWGHPAHLAPFPPGPFAGLPPLGMAPPPDGKTGAAGTDTAQGNAAANAGGNAGGDADVRVTRQVLAEPAADLPGHSWAMLEDGTPLVTETARGAGRIVLFHVTANAEWSSLPLSGLFVEMLRRLTGLAAGVAAVEPDAMLAPAEVLDGFGQPGSPPQAATPLRARDFATTPVSPRHPPGLYGPEQGRRALNTGTAAPALAPAAPIPGALRVTASLLGHQRAFGPMLIAAALALLAADLLLSLALRGMLRRRSAAPRPPSSPSAGTGGASGRRGVLAGFAGSAIALTAFGTPGLAEPPKEIARSGIAGDPDSRFPSLAIHLAYVVTGDAQQDQISRLGLAGLADYVSHRTAATIAAPAGVIPGQDDLSYYPLLYWPLSSGEAPPEAMLSALNGYMAHGGIVLIDTRDAGAGAGMNGGAGQVLQAIGRALNVPPLTPLTPEHVLSRSFYLLHDFPGRYTGGQVWVQRDEDRANDSVSPVIVGGNDWAAAWAADDQGGHPYATIPGGARQRTLAYRFGTNLVMYALTGNYKGDQVHVPAILDRLGQ